MKLSHLKVFGCVSYVHVSDHVRNKLDSKSLKCTFIGYGDEEFSYRFWDDQNKKAIRSRDVKFNEFVMYKDINTSQFESLVQPEYVYFESEDILESGVTYKTGQNL